MAEVTKTIQNQVTELYLAFFDRAPDASGFAYWTQQVANGGITPNTLANQFANTPEFQAVYGGLGYTEQVTKLYWNVLDRAPDADGLAYWVKELKAGTPIGTVAWQIVNAAFTQVGTQDGLLVQNKVAVGEYFAMVLASNDKVAAGKAFELVTSDPASILKADAALAHLVGTAYTLTTNIDHVNVPAGTGIDSVNGTIDVVANSSGFGFYGGISSAVDNSTFSAGDTIRGNGNTVVNIDVKSLQNYNYYVGPESQYVAGKVTMQGVSQINLIASLLTSYPFYPSDLKFDASTYGSVNTITVSGSRGWGSGELRAKFDALQVTSGSLNLSIDGVTHADLYVAGQEYWGGNSTVDGLKVEAYLENHVNNGVGVKAVLGTAGIDVVAGIEAHANVGLWNGDVHGTSAYITVPGKAATVGNVNIDHINLNAATGAGVDAWVGNSASALSANATAGNVSVGSIKLNAAVGGYAAATLSNLATADDGNATVGNITAGDVTMVGAQSAYVEFDVNNDADATGKGNALAGNTTIGNVSFAVGKSGGGGLEVYNSAQATTGNATAGNTTVGNVGMVLGKSATAEFYINNYASATTGNATAGNLTVGNIGVTLAKGASIVVDGASDVDVAGPIWIANSAYVASSGNAAVGNLQLGSVSLNVANEGVDFIALNEAYLGEAGVGTVQAGNLTITGDINLLNASNEADSNIVIGNGAGVYFNSTTYALSAAKTATAGNVSLQNIILNAAAATDVNNSVYIVNAAHATDGAAKAGTMTVGNITANAGNNVSDGSVDVQLWNVADGTTGDSTGKVTVGNVRMIGTYNANIALAVNNLATNGSTGGIQVGAIDLEAANKASDSAVALTLLQGGPMGVGGQGTGSTTVTGDIVLSAANIGMLIENEAGSGNPGGITLQNVSLTGNGSAPLAIMVANTVAGNNGNIQVGNVSMTVTTGEHQHLDVYNLADGAAGNITLGNVGFTIGKSAGAELNVATVSEALKKGNITIGNITLTPTGESSAATTTASAAHALVTAVAEEGKVTVGNVTVKGGTQTTKGQLLDNFSILSNQTADSWLHLDGTPASATNLATIGNVDYSGYAGIGAVNKTVVTASEVDLFAVSDVSALSAGTYTITYVKGTSTYTQGWTATGDDAADLTAFEQALSTLISVNSLTGTVTTDGTGGHVVVTGLNGYTTGSSSTGFTASGNSVDTVSATAATTATVYGTLIDVSDFSGAASITGATGGSTIIDNSGQNAITLKGAGKVDVVDLLATQTNVSESGEVITAPQSLMDSITGFATGDTLQLTTGVTSGTINLVTISAFKADTSVTIGSITYAQFLTNAETYFGTVANGAAYAAQVGANTYVALEDASGNVAEVVQLVGVNAANLSLSGGHIVSA